LHFGIVLALELTILTLIRSFREADYCLYLEALAELLLYFFANNNVNYARRLSIHLGDMMTIDQKHPEMAREFFKGHFVVHKSCKEFSSIAIDQAHEQNNAVIKDDGGAIGPTEDPTALRRWMRAGPEVSRLVTRYEEGAGTKHAKIGNRHHEQGGSGQKTFFDKVEKLFTVFKEMGNPFEEESADLLVLDTKDVADPANLRLVLHTIAEAKISSNLSLKDRRADLVLSTNQKEPDHFLQARGDTERGLPPIFQLFISCHSRQCDLHEFFQHENQSTPASLSDSGKLHTCQKSQLVEILESNTLMPNTEPQQIQSS